MKKVTIIRELNAYESTPNLFDRLRLRLGLSASVPCRGSMSVWLTFEEDFEGFTETGTRIIGPVAEEQADAVAGQLESAFRAAGFEVRLEVAADD